MDIALLQHLHLKRQFDIGQSSAEALKLALSEALASARTHVEVRGLDMRSGLPRVLQLEVGELRPILEKHAMEVAAAVRSAFAVTDPDLACGILEDGISLTGGAALTALVAERIEETTGIAVHCAENPQKAVANGLAILLN